METFKEYIEKLDKLEFEKMYENDLIVAWGFLYSATTLQEHVLVSLQRVIFWA